MSDAQALASQVAQLTTSVQSMERLLTTMLGTRLSREQFAERLGVHRNTLRQRLATDRTMPRPGSDGKWLLSEIVEWEQRRR